MHTHTHARAHMRDTIDEGKDTHTMAGWMDRDIVATDGKKEEKKGKVT